MHERHERVDRWTLDATQTNTSKAFWFVHFNCHSNGNQVAAIVGLRAWALGLYAFSSAQRQEGLIDFNSAAQQFAIRTYHRPTKPMQHCPRSLVAVQTEHSLQPKSTDALLLVGDVPRRSEPDPQRGACLVEDCSGRHAALMSATSADQPAPCSTFGPIQRPASGATEPVRPSQTLQVRCAGFIAGKPVLEFNPGARVLFSVGGFDWVHQPMIDVVELSG